MKSFDERMDLLVVLYEAVNGAKRWGCVGHQALCRDWTEGLL